MLKFYLTGASKVNEGNSGQWVTPDSDSSCSESAAADAPARGKAFPPPHAASLTGGGVGCGRFAARTVAVRSYPLSGVPPIYRIHYGAKIASGAHAVYTLIKDGDFLSP